MTDHVCRVCGCILTLDNIYPGHIKKHNWICKSCDNKRRHPPKKPDYDPKDVAFKSSSISNHIKCDAPSRSSSACCQDCASYCIMTRTCHHNPPPWPRVYPDDWCRCFETLG